MTVLDVATGALRELESELLASAGGEVDPVRLAERIRAVRKLLAGDESRWIGTTEARRLLGLGSENTVKAWVRTGLLHGRLLPNGRVHVLLEDVLRRREESEGLSAVGGDDLSTDELGTLREGRPGTNPWERSSSPLRQ